MYRQDQERFKGDVMGFILGMMVGSFITAIIVLMAIGSAETDVDRYEGLDETK